MKNKIKGFLDKQKPKLKRLEDYIHVKSQDQRFLKKAIQWVSLLTLFSYLPFITFVCFIVGLFLVKQLYILKAKEYSNFNFLQYIPPQVNKFFQQISQSNQFEEERKFDEIKAMRKNTSTQFQADEDEERKEEYKDVALDENQQHYNTKLIRKHQLSIDDLTEYDTNGLQFTQNIAQTSKSLFPWQYLNQQKVYQGDQVKQFRHQLPFPRSHSSDKTTGTPFIDQQSDEVPKTIILKKSNQFGEINVIQQDSRLQKRNQNEKWERFESLYQKLKSHMPKIESGANPLEQVYKYFQVMRSLSQIQRNGKRLMRVDDKMLIKLFLVSSAGLIAQSIISKRSRKYLLQTFVIMFYMGCAALSAGSMSLLLLKTLKKQK